MQRKSIITLAAAALVGFAVLVPQAASAQMRFGMHSAFVPHAAFHNGFAFHNRVAFHSFPFHHRFFAFRRPFVFSTVVANDVGCFRVRPVWTPWGWRWRRIWVCG